MNQTQTGTNTNKLTAFLSPWPVATFFLCFSLIVVSHASFWIDESITAYIANEPTLSQFWKFLTTSHMSDVQMPLYVIYIWTWAKLFGIGEIALRLAGTLWLVAGLALFVVSFPQWQKRLAALLVVAANAFVWFYANEARSYSMQLGSSCMVIAAINRLASGAVAPDKERKWTWLFAFGMFVLCASSMLAMIWASAALGAVCVLFPKKRLLEWWWRDVPLWVSLTIFLVALGCYYVWTVRLGAGGSQLAATDLKTTLFILYEHFGFTGWGPGRTELRAGGVSALTPYAAGLACYAVALLVILYFAVNDLWRKSPRKLTGVAIVIVLPWAFLSVVGMITHFRLLGRHSSPIAPAFFFLMATGVANLATRRGWIGKAAVFVFLVMGLISALRVRFDYRQSKDDYRKAASIAQAGLSKGETVWWNADYQGAWYYHVPVEDAKLTPGKALLIRGPADDALAKLPPPKMIVISWPDIFDAGGALARYVSTHGYQVTEAFPAFKICQAKGALQHP